MGEPNQRGDRGARWSSLLALLSEQGRLTVPEVVQQLGVSPATVRRDFRDLAEQQLVTRTHGGVVATAVAYDLPVRYKRFNVEGPKDRIATYAANLLEAGQVVAFNGGTTTTATARALVTRPDIGARTHGHSITVVTNALNIAAEMVLRPFVRTVCLGGVARPESYELTGHLAAVTLQELALDVAVLGVDAISADTGAMCRHEGEAEVSRLMAAKSSRVIVVASGDKVGGRSFGRICAASDVGTVVTDETADDAAVNALTRAGVTVHVV